MMEISQSADVIVCYRNKGYMNQNGHGEQYGRQRHRLKLLVLYGLQQRKLASLRSTCKREELL